MFGQTLDLELAGQIMLTEPGTLDFWMNRLRGAGRRELEEILNEGSWIKRPKALRVADAYLKQRGYVLHHDSEQGPRIRVIVPITISR